MTRLSQRGYQLTPFVNGEWYLSKPITEWRIVATHEIGGGGGGVKSSSVHQLAAVSANAAPLPKPETSAGVVVGAAAAAIHESSSEQEYKAQILEKRRRSAMLFRDLITIAGSELVDEKEVPVAAAAAPPPTAATAENGEPAPISNEVEADPLREDDDVKMDDGSEYVASTQTSPVHTNQTTPPNSAGSKTMDHLIPVASILCKSSLPTTMNDFTNPVSTPIEEIMDP